jgi:uncharacterized protein YdaU (DUF1376 family)
MEVPVGSVNVWMPLYWADYWYDTQDLTDSQHVVYWKTMSAYWASGGALPDKVFRSICKREFPRVADFYAFRDGKWHHKRIDKELAKARKLQKAAHEKAMKGVAARRAMGQI